MTRLFPLIFVWLTGCARPALPAAPARQPIAPEHTEVVILGTIHGHHYTTPAYTVQVLQDLVRRIAPDVACVEVPPGRLEQAVAQYRRDGVITEPRTLVFPEYVEGLIPIMDELGLPLAPCAAWTSDINRARSAALARLASEQPEAKAEMDAASNAAGQWIHDQGLDRDPAGIHTNAYDDAVRRGMAPYERLYTAAEGPGGWDAINRAHWALISSVIEAHRGQRVLVMFGSWHKYWFMERARERDDIDLIELSQFL